MKYQHPKHRTPPVSKRTERALVDNRNHQSPRLARLLVQRTSGTRIASSSPVTTIRIATVNGRMRIVVSVAIAEPVCIVLHVI